MSILSACTYSRRFQPRLTVLLTLPLTLILVGSALTRPALAEPSNPGHFANAIEPGLYRLDGADPTLPSADLAPLRRIVGDAQFVGVGEPTHTSGGFYQMKHRVFRYLVEEMGFRVLGFESPFEWGVAMESYLQGCASPSGPGSTSDDALNALFTVYWSTEVRDVAEWMCGWNQQHPKDSLHFYTFDIQRQSKSAADALFAFLERLEDPVTEPWIEGIALCDGVVDSFYPSQPFPTERYNACMAALDAVDEWFDAHEKDIVHRTSREDLAWARVYQVIERSWQGMLYYIRTDFPRSYAFREEGMAYLTIAIHQLRFPHEKVMLWAHNGHVVRDSMPYNELTSQGSLLAPELGRKYVIIAQAAFESSADWPAAGRCGVANILDNPPLEGLLHETGEPFLLLDLDPRGSHPSFLDPEAGWSIGGSYPIQLQHHYDAVIYQDASPAMHPLAWPACQ